MGLYVPGGSAPLLSTALMLGVPALLAGCREIVVCTPPGKTGTIAPAVLAAAAHDYGVFWFEQGENGQWTRHVIDNAWSQGHASTLVDLLRLEGALL